MGGFLRASSTNPLVFLSPGQRNDAFGIAGRDTAERVQGEDAEHFLAIWPNLGLHDEALLALQLRHGGQFALRRLALAREVEDGPSSLDVGLCGGPAQGAEVG